MKDPLTIMMAITVLLTLMLYLLWKVNQQIGSLCKKLEKLEADVTDIGDDTIAQWEMLNNMEGKTMN